VVVVGLVGTVVVVVVGLVGTVVVTADVSSAQSTVDDGIAPTPKTRIGTIAMADN
jgi:hypothetical protein